MMFVPDVGCWIASASAIGRREIIAKQLKKNIMETDMTKEHAIDWIKRSVKKDSRLWKAIESLVPKLTESKDERIGNLIYCIVRDREDVRNTLESNGVSVDDALAYLEKQKEQKPLSTEETELNSIAFLEQMGYTCIPPESEKKPVEYLDKHKVYAIMIKLHELALSSVIPINSDAFKKIGEITSDVRRLLDYPIEQKPAEWSEEDGMEAINVFRPLAGTSIESATKQAVNKFTNSGKKFLLAFNGVFILIDNTKSVQDIVSEYNRSLGGKKKEQGQSEGEPNDFEITLNDCMLAAQQYPPGKIGWDDVKMWAEELSNYCPQPNQKWSEFDLHCLERAIWYVENPAPNVVKDTNLGLWLQSLKNRGNFLKSNDNSSIKEGQR